MDDKITVWSEKIPNLVSIRFAWKNNPDVANLYNKEGLPASLFRTDEF
jgi:sialate O-acetylesterase